MQVCVDIDKRNIFVSILSNCARVLPLNVNKEDPKNRFEENHFISQHAPAQGMPVMSQ